MRDRLKEIKTKPFVQTSVDDYFWLIAEAERRHGEEVELDMITAQLHAIHGWKPDLSRVVMIDLLGRQRQGQAVELNEVHDTLAEALGYQKAPTLEEDPDCPCPGDYVTGEHTAATLAAEAATALKDRDRQIAELRAKIANLRTILTAAGKTET
jgi:hypothetical protein